MPGSASEDQAVNAAHLRRLEPSAEGFRWEVCGLCPKAWPPEGPVGRQVLASPPCLAASPHGLATWFHSILSASLCLAALQVPWSLSRHPCILETKQGFVGLITDSRIPPLGSLFSGTSPLNFQLSHLSLLHRAGPLLSA